MTFSENPPPSPVSAILKPLSAEEREKKRLELKERLDKVLSTPSPADPVEKPKDEPIEQPKEVGGERSELIKKAITFLSSESVRSASEDKKKEFLRKKGLTDEEIDQAMAQVPPLPPSPSTTSATASTTTTTTTNNQKTQVPPIWIVLNQSPTSHGNITTNGDTTMLSRAVLLYALTFGCSVYNVARYLTKHIYPSLKQRIADYAQLRTLTLEKSHSLHSELGRLCQSLQRLEFTQCQVNLGTEKESSSLELLVKVQENAKEFKYWLDEQSYPSRWLPPGMAMVSGSITKKAENPTNHAWMNSVGLLKSEIRALKGNLLGWRTFPNITTT